MGAGTADAVPGQRPTLGPPRAVARPARLAAAFAAAAALVGAGCGSGGGSTSTATRPPASSGAGKSTGTASTPGGAPSFAQPSGGGRLTIHQIYERSRLGVAFIQAKIVQTVQSPFGFPVQQQGIATGSGVVLDGKGDILTNNHVVAGAQKGSVTVRIGQQAPVNATFVGNDPSSDLAVIRINPGDTHISPLPLGDSDKVEVGESVVAMGNPLGFANTVTSGIVSALQREIQAPNKFPIFNVIQTDAPINPGNSGGPLIDPYGRVIGINSQIATAGQSSPGQQSGSIGIGFAIPINTAKRELGQIEKTGHFNRSYLGAVLAPVTTQIAQALHLPVKQGILVERVVPGGPADQAGLRGGHRRLPNGIVVGGDLIVSIAGQKVTGPVDALAALSRHKPGDKVPVVYYRGADKRTTTVTLGTRPRRLPAG